MLKVSPFSIWRSLCRVLYTCATDIHFAMKSGYSALRIRHNLDGYYPYIRIKSLPLPQLLTHSQLRFTKSVHHYNMISDLDRADALGMNGLTHSVATPT